MFCFVLFGWGGGKRTLDMHTATHTHGLGHERTQHRVPRLAGEVGGEAPALGRRVARPPALPLEEQGARAAGGKQNKRVSKDGEGGGAGKGGPSEDKQMEGGRVSVWGFPVRPFHSAFFRLLIFLAVSVLRLIRFGSHARMCVCVCCRLTEIFVFPLPNSSLRGPLFLPSYVLLSITLCIGTGIAYGCRCFC